MNDLSDFISKTDEIVVELTHPKTREVLKNPDDTVMSITLFSHNTQEYKDAEYVRIDDNYRKADGDKDYRPSAKDIIESNIKFLSNITKRWNITLEGKVPDKKEAYNIYNKIRFIKEQLEKNLEADEDFTYA